MLLLLSGSIIQWDDDCPQRRALRLSSSLVTATIFGSLILLIFLSANISGGFIYTISAGSAPSASLPEATTSRISRFAIGVFGAQISLTRTSSARLIVITNVSCVLELRCTRNCEPITWPSETFNPRAAPQIGFSNSLIGKVSESPTPYRYRAELSFCLPAGRPAGVHAALSLFLVLFLTASLKSSVSSRSQCSSFREYPPDSRPVHRRLAYKRKGERSVRSADKFSFIIAQLVERTAHTPGPHCPLSTTCTLLSLTAQMRLP